jgi:putative tryptophan/tyrosine transport system substrate-binding protein
VRRRGFIAVVALGGLAAAAGASHAQINRSWPFRRLARDVDALLKRAKPSALPIELPTQYDLVINLKTAERLGIAIPPSILLRADEVIE